MTEKLAPDQMLLYMDDVRSITKASLQCTWYMPKKSRRCSMRTTIQEAELVRWLMAGLQQSLSDPLQKGVLMYMIENLCCNQYHRAMVRNSGLRERLAVKWLKELRTHPTNPKCTRFFDLMSECTVGSIMFLQSASLHSGTKSKVKTETGETPGCEAEVESAETILSEFLDDVSKSQTASAFEPHARLPNEDLASKLVASLRMTKKNDHSEDEKGFVYLFIQKIFPGYVKIGYSNVSVDGRLEYYSECHQRSPDLVMSFEDVPCAERVETLIHFELNSYWRRELRCPKHEKTHVEWFEISMVKALEVADFCIEWMQRAKPYDKHGFLKKSWKDMIQWLCDWKIPITARLLLDFQELDEHVQYKLHVGDGAPNCAPCDLLQFLKRQ